MPFPNLLAGGVTNEGSSAPFHLFAGDSKVVTGQGDFGADCAQFQVLGRKTSDGKYYPHAPAASDGTEKAVAIAAQPVVIANQVPGPVYLGGYFNHAALVWAAATDLLSERKAAFDGTAINIGKLL